MLLDFFYITIKPWTLEAVLDPLRSILGFKVSSQRVWVHKGPSYPQEQPAVFSADLAALWHPIKAHPQ